MEFSKQTLKEAIQVANTGLDAIKRAPIVDYDTGIKCLRIQDISQQKEYSNWGFAEVQPDNFKKFRLRKNDILIARTGASIGVNRFISAGLRAVYNNGLIRIRISQEEYYPEYIYYLMQSRAFKNHINAIAFSTSAQPNMKIRDFLRFTFVNLPLAEQQRIAAVLGALDDKIELNRKMNRTLEEMAQALFKSRFIDFDDHDDLVPSELGPIPRGWEAITLGDKRHFIQCSDNVLPYDGKKAYIATADVRDLTLINERFLSFQKKPSRANRNPGMDRIWFARMKDSRKVLYTMQSDKEFWKSRILSTGFAGIECKYRPLSSVLACFLASKDFDATKNRLATGTTMQGVNNKSIASIGFILPSLPIIDELSPTLSALFRRWWANQHESRTLAQLRDTLLPKLISGEIRVPEAEQQLESVL